MPARPLQPGGSVGATAVNRKPDNSGACLAGDYYSGMRHFIYPFGRSLSLLAAIVSGILHLGTFVRIVEPIWIVIPACCWVGACICDRAVERQIVRGVPSRTTVNTSLLLLAYATGTFLYFHKATNGATGVTFDNGQYFSLYKSQVVGTISRYDYLKFPTLETRVLSAWCGMLSSFALQRFPADGRTK